MQYIPGPFPPASPTISFQWLFEEWVKPLLVVVVVVSLMNLVFPRYAVHGHSMEPSLHESDRLFVSNLDALNRQFTRGEVVVLTSPYDGENVVKRVIGLPGETVAVRDGVVYINDEPLNEPYINEAPRYSGQWVVPEGHYFIMGDNRNHSLDSADYGPVSADAITGVVKFRFLPLDQLSWFGSQDYQN